MSRYTWLLPVLLLAGCGGSGSHSEPAAEEAAIDAAKAAHAYRYMTAISRLDDSVLAGDFIGTKIYDPLLNADYVATVGEGGVFNVAFTHHVTGASLGSATIAITDGLPLPITVHQTIDATFDGTHIVGDVQIVNHDDAGLVNEVHGEYHLSNPDTDAVFDLTTDATGAVTGTFDSTVDNGDDVDFDTITITPTFETDATFTAHGETGTLSLEADGSGHTNVPQGSGSYSVTWTSAWNLTLTRPDGSTKVLGPVANL